MACKKISEDALCIIRKIRGRGYEFFDQNSSKISNQTAIKRFKALVIPPNWEDVKICNHKDGHIQAVGRDEKGRKQYIYHQDWTEEQQRIKYDRLSKFGKLLPRLRKKAYQDLKENSWTREKVLGLLIAILDETGIRIGSKQYEQKNSTYGLTTLRRKHLNIEGKSLQFLFKGKSNIEREVTIEDIELIKHIKETAELPGYEIFKFKQGYRDYSNVDSADVNGYIENAIGEGFSSKDFRTWVGSRLSIELFPDAKRMFDESGRKKLENCLLELVSKELGNTPTICKEYYIHPVLMEKIGLDEFPAKLDFKDSETDFGLRASEKQLLKMLEK